MLRLFKGIWTLALALALIASAPSVVSPVWAGPGDTVGDDPGGGGSGGGGGESGDPDQPIGGFAKGSGIGSSYARPTVTRFGQGASPSTVNPQLLRAQLLMHWLKLAFFARGF